MPLKTDFRILAMDFVRQNNCAIHTPVDLIEKAMIVGAQTAGIEMATRRIRKVKEELKQRRERNFIG